MKKTFCSIHLLLITCLNVHAVCCVQYEVTECVVDSLHLIMETLRASLLCYKSFMTVWWSSKRHNIAFFNNHGSLAQVSSCLSSLLCSPSSSEVLCLTTFNALRSPWSFQDPSGHPEPMRRSHLVVILSKTDRSGNYIWDFLSHFLLFCDFRHQIVNFVDVPVKHRRPQREDMNMCAHIQKWQKSLNWWWS